MCFHPIGIRPIKLKVCQRIFIAEEVCLVHMHKKSKLVWTIQLQSRTNTVSPRYLENSRNVSLSYEQMPQNILFPQ